MKFKRGDILRVDWLDTFSHSKWIDEEEIDKIVDWQVNSVGHFITENKNYLVLATSKAESGYEKKWSDLLSITKGTIKKIQKVKEF